MPPRKKTTPAAPAGAEPEEQDIELQDDGPDLPVAPKSEQFPSLAGDPNKEVDQRTADGDGSDGRFRKTFVLDAEVDPELVFAEHADEIRRDAARRGLRATGDPELIDKQVARQRRSVTTTLTYAMPAEPAAVADNQA